jgi:hypothetical protein
VRTDQPAPTAGGLRLPATDLVLFAATLLLAALQHWSVTDLVWGLWISSLLVGYTLIVTYALAQPLQVRGDHRLPRTLLALAGSLFLIAFFTLHFGGFHFVHSIFLNAFFPLTGADVFGTSPPETAGWWFALIGEAVRRYWPFVLFSALSAREAFRRAGGGSDDAPLMAPYKNVVRMHLMIFVFAFLSITGLEGWGLWILLCFYFFPVGALLRTWRGHPTRTTEVPS